MVTGRATTSVIVACPECDDDIRLKGEIQWGNQVVCPHCGTDLEVINTNPVELDWVYEQSDYDYEDDDDDDW
jgi:alpha-aminoadipate carrier protein LysW